MALAGGLIFDLAGSEESQQNGPSGAVRIFVFIHMCPSPFHTFVMPARLNPVLAQGAWRVANVAEKVEGAGEGMWCQAEQQGTTSLFSSPCHGWQAAICTLSSPGPQRMGGGCRCASPGRRHT